MFPLGNVGSVTNLVTCDLANLGQPYNITMELNNYLKESSRPLVPSPNATHIQSSSLELSLGSRVVAGTQGLEPSLLPPRSSSAGSWNWKWSWHLNLCTLVGMWMYQAGSLFFF